MAGVVIAPCCIGAGLLKSAKYPTGYLRRQSSRTTCKCCCRDSLEIELAERMPLQTTSGSDVATWPDRFDDEDHLEDFMTTPSPALIASLRDVGGDLMILGIVGKMGPTLARLARRAAPDRRILGVARFSEPGLREKLQSWGIDCIAADLLERESIARLPKAP